LHRLVSVLKDPQFRANADHRKATLLSRLACLRVLVCREVSGLPYLQRKRLVREKLDL